MPDPMPLLRAFGASAVVAAVLVLLFGWPWRSPNPTRRALGEVLGVAAAIYLGGWMLGLSLAWPPTHGPSRFFLILLPAVILVEIIGAFPKVPQLLIWVLRLVIAAGAARVLLHNSSYLKDLKATGSPDWSPIEAAAWLGGLAVALRAVWLSLTGWNRRVPEPWAAGTLAVTTAGAAVAVMLSDYSTGSTLGLSLTGAMVGISLAGLLLTRSPGADGAIAVGVVGLFGLLAIGYFFASLPLLHAGLLLLAPAAYWLGAFPSVDKLRPWLRGLVAGGLTAIVVAGAVYHANREPERDQPASSSSPDEQAPEDLYK